ncbi:insertion element iso-iS1d protein insA [Porphyromonadaceae bacterium COT-184 OH4590]|nr:insertion element iso-iS1d protein insA [Porphyromonadaceae bacterium COT-184 OH4590]
MKKKSTTKTPEQKRLALQLYLEGLGFRAIGRVLNISYVTVFQWVKKWGEQAELPKSEEPVGIVELDEIHTCVQHKKTTVGSGLLLIDMGKGSSILFVGKGTP